MFPKIIDIMFVASLVVVLIVAAGMAASPFGGAISFLITLCAGVLGIIISFGVIYLLIDIRDLLQNK
ncbi:MAG: hypothetical protein FWF99_04725, partial [Desulfovibrionaceae bacterium]|nr:hypothetical protein [Desulfovibrionaceae bacterium]